MQDLQTESLWSQISGECIAGESKGKKLTLYPVIHTTYDQFKQLYPEGQLLKKPELGADGSHYDGYFSDAEKLGIFGRADNFKKLKGKDKILGWRWETNILPSPSNI